MKHSNFFLRKVLLALLMSIALCGFAQNSFWAGGIHYQIIPNNNANYNTVKVISGSSDSYSGVIMIPRVVSTDVTNSYGECYKKMYEVTEVGEDAFRDCMGLTGVVLPSSIMNIDKNAFYGCTGLTSVTIPNGVNTIGASAFGYCAGLTDIVLPNSVMTMDANVFYGCTSLTSVTLSKSLTSLVGTFHGCNALTSVNIPANVKVLDGTFHGCSSLSNVTLPKSIRIIGANTFDGCTALQRVWLPSTIEQIGDRAFAETGLTTVELPNSLKSLGEDAFYGCASLMEVTVRSTDPPAMTNRETFPDKTYNKGMLIIPEVSSDAYDSADWWSYFMNPFNSPGLEAPYDFEVDGIYYLITAPSTVDVVYKDMGYNSYSGTVNIPATVSDGRATFNVRAIGNSAFRDCQGLTAVTIPASVTIIGSHAFDGCSGLTHIDLPETVTEIGDSAFMACTGITDLTIPVNLAAMGTDALAGIPVQSLTWYARECWGGGNMNTLGICQLVIGNEVAVLPDRFAYQSNITSVTLPSTLTTIGNEAFYGCHDLTELTIPEEVSRIGVDALRDTGISSLTWNARECWTCGCVASGYSPYLPVNEVNIGDKVRVLPNGFIHHSSITSLTIPSSVRYIGNNAFYYCYGLTDVVIPDSIIAIGDEAFLECSGLHDLTIGKNVSSLGNNAFGGLCYLKRLTWNARWCESLGGMNYQESLEQVTIGNEVELIPDDFMQSSAITSVEIPGSVNVIGNNAFAYTELKSLFIPRSVTAIGRDAFSGCNPYLESIVVESGNPVYDSRDNCNALLLTQGDSLLLTCMNTVIPAAVTVIPPRAFYYVQGLQSIEIPPAVTTIGDFAFYWCRGLKGVVIPASVTSIGNYVFTACSSLETMRVEAGNTVYDSRGNCQAIIETATSTLMAGCKNTVIPSSVKTIGEASFRYCSSLTSIVIPDEVTLVKKSAFESCGGLKKVTIGRSVQEIDSYAFAGCGALETVTSLAVAPPRVNKWTFNNYYSYSSMIHAKLRVPEAALEAYMADENWGRFEQIEAIPGFGPGDIDGDGRLSIGDVTSLIDLILGDEETLQDNPYADVNGDGVVNISDVTALIDALLDS